jgi:hypothetical protein
MPKRHEAAIFMAFQKLISAFLSFSAPQWFPKFYEEVFQLLHMSYTLRQEWESYGDSDIMLNHLFLRYTQDISYNKLKGRIL